MKKLTLILAAVALNLFSIDAMAVKHTNSHKTTLKGQDIRKGLIVDVNNGAGKIMDQETGAVYPFELRGIEKDDIKRGMLVNFIVPPGAAIAAAHNNNNSNNNKNASALTALISVAIITAVTYAN